MDPRVQAMQRDDVLNLLDHIAWREVIQPKLHQHREALQKQLVQAVLGAPMLVQGRGPGLTKEQLAGRIDGIDWIERVINRVLTDGQKAIVALQTANVSIEDLNSTEE